MISLRKSEQGHFTSLKKRSVYLLGRENIIAAKIHIIILIAAKIYKKVSFYAVFNLYIAISYS